MAKSVLGDYLAYFAMLGIDIPTLKQAVTTVSTSGYKEGDGDIRWYAQLLIDQASREEIGIPMLLSRWDEYLISADALITTNTPVPSEAEQWVHGLNAETMFGFDGVPEFNKDDFEVPETVVLCERFSSNDKNLKSKFDALRTVGCNVLVASDVDLYVTLDACPITVEHAIRVPSHSVRSGYTLWVYGRVEPFSESDLVLCEDNTIAYAQGLVQQREAQDIPSEVISHLSAEAVGWRNGSPVGLTATSLWPEFVVGSYVWWYASTHDKINMHSLKTSRNWLYHTFEMAEVADAVIRGGTVDLEAYSKHLVDTYSRSCWGKE